MSIPQGCPPTELVIGDIIGSDQFPDDLKVYAENWNDYHCQRRKWEGFGFCHWFFWSDKYVSQFSSFGLPDTWIKEKIKSILVDVEGQGDFLVQFCYEEENKNIQTLTTIDWEKILVYDMDPTILQKIITGRHQPFGLNSTNMALYAYASLSRFYESDGTSEQQHFELVNRVFRSRRAECTTKRRAYPIPPRAAAVDCNITASLAFPVFHFGNIVGVIEIVTISDRPTNELYGIFRQIVSKYKESVWGNCAHLIEQNDKKEEALEEIKKSLEEACRIHDTPLSRTWIPCRICDDLFLIHQVINGRGNSHIQPDNSHFPGNLPSARIKKGQGAVGMAFLSDKLEFCENFLQVSRTDPFYPPLPLSLRQPQCHRLTACFAVPLRRRSSSLNEEDDVYVVEFFLPPNYVEFGDWRTTAFSLLSTMGQHLKSVSIASEGEIGGDLPTSFELLQQDVGMELEEAAKTIGDKQIGETSETPISDPSVNQDISSMTIKAKFGANDYIKFELPIMSEMREFQHQVEKRLHWMDGTYSVRYQDDDNHSIFIFCDDDLQYYMRKSKAMGRSIVMVSLQPITNFPN